MKLRGSKSCVIPEEGAGWEIGELKLLVGHREVNVTLVNASWEEERSTCARYNNNFPTICTLCGLRT